MLEKITVAFSDIIRGLSGKSTITKKNIEDSVERIKLSLLDADVNLRVVRRFVNSTIEEATGEAVLRSVNPGEQFTKIIYDKLVGLLGSSKADLKLKGTDTQSVILLLGLNGAGKTTCSAKLALRLKGQGRRPLLVAADTTRAAARQQLKVLSETVGVPYYTQEVGDPIAIARSALSYAKKNAIDTVIVDTAGRMQLDEELMQEIASVKRAINPDETILVADAMTGQNASDIAKSFDEKVGLTGVVLTKFDSDARGGAALSLRTVTGKPILFIGTGEKVADLEPFYPERIAQRILGMGDIVSLVEKAQGAISRDEALRLQKKMARDNFTLEDMLAQLDNVDKMGDIHAMLDMIPGLAGRVSEEDIDLNKLKRQRAIILSMTKKERVNHLIIGPSRRKRIARGSGVTVQEVNRLLKQFEKTKLTMKKIAKNKGLQAKLMEQMAGGKK